MSGLLKSKKAMVTGAALILVAGTLFAVRHSIFREEKPAPAKAEAKAGPRERLPLPPPAFNETWDWSQKAEPKAPARVSNASIPKDTLSSLRKALAGMGQWKGKDRSKDKSQRPDKAEKEEISKKIKELRREVSPLLRESEVARQELLAAIKEESDPYVKKELARLLNVADAESQSKYYAELAQDRSPDNQKVAVEMLGNLRTPDALTRLTDMAESPSIDAEVRSEAVMGIGRSVTFAAGDEKYQAEGRQTLLELTQGKFEPEIREKAYRAIAMQPSLTAEDEAFLAKAIEQESDPKVKRIAEFTQSVIEARQRSAQH
ncbi:MAG TPA: HEAT repeat domain-containing protein [bacterium]|nr:HEAT repeat domain-containing protein [bacterium]